MAEESDTEIRLGFIETQVSQISDLQTNLDDAREVIEQLVWAINELIDLNDLAVNAEIDAAIESGRVLAGGGCGT